jgi:hypothetical protein
MAGFGWSFVITGYWIDPFLSTGGCLAGVLFIFLLRTGISRRGARRFRIAYGPSVSQSALRQLISAGRPRLSQSIVSKAAIIALKDTSFPGREDRDEPQQAAKALGEFRKKAKELFTAAGAAVVGYEGNVIIASFGSPLEWICFESAENPLLYDINYAREACDFVAEILRDGNVPWRFGIAYGDCVFSWAAETGYTANGSPVVRARILLSATARMNSSALIGSSVSDELETPLKRLGVISLEGSESRETFYELPL